jgi:hypothetical protein
LPPLVDPESSTLASRRACWHLLALQRSIGNHAVGQLLQRKVRVDGGKKRVDEAYYKTGKGKSLGPKRTISSLIDYPLRRVFEDAVRDRADVGTVIDI